MAAKSQTGVDARQVREANINSFKDLTHQLNNYNEIFNLNMYLNNLGSSENTRLTKINENMKSKILMQKQEYMTLDRTVQYSNLRNNLIYFSFIIICIILIIITMFMKKALDLRMTIIITSVVAVFYIVVSMLIINNNANRRSLVWDQYYWPDIKQK